MKTSLHGSEKEQIMQLFYYPEIDEQKITSILWFSIIWSLFEDKCCVNKAKINTHAPKLSKYTKDLDLDLLLETWNYFHCRYIKNSKPTELFNNFNFNDGDNKELVKNSLIRNTLSSQTQKTEALLRIFFRLRNNLLHGEKDVETLYRQNESFAYANKLLLNVIEVIQRAT